MARIDMNTEEIPPASSGFDPLPAGKYVVVLDEAEVKPLKDPRKGKRLTCSFAVIEGPCEGRKLFQSYNLWYTDPEDEDKGAKVKAISESQFASLINATGRVVCSDTDELLNQPVVAVVTVRPASNGYDASNDIKRFELRDGTPVPTGAGAAQSSVGSSKPARTGAPWRNK